MFNWCIGTRFDELWKQNTLNLKYGSGNPEGLLGPSLIQKGEPNFAAFANNLNGYF